VNKGPIDEGRLGRLRSGRGEIANHVIDEFAAGRLSRRDFIRRGTVIGLSAPLLGSVLAACSSSSSASSRQPRRSTP
jgi:peptide/nickel transport system substrate-binding protein